MSTEDAGGEGSNRGSESPVTMQTLQDTVTTVSSEGNGGDSTNNNGDEDIEETKEEEIQERDDIERGGGGDDDVNVTRKKTVTIADVEEIEL